MTELEELRRFFEVFLRLEKAHANSPDTPIHTHPLWAHLVNQKVHVIVAQRRK